MASSLLFVERPNRGRTRPAASGGADLGCAPLRVKMKEALNRRGGVPTLTIGRMPVVGSALMCSQSGAAEDRRVSSGEAPRR